MSSCNGKAVVRWWSGAPSERREVGETGREVWDGTLLRLSVGTLTVSR